MPAAPIEQEGAVSEAVARAMADGALTHSQAHVSLAVTGVAYPTGGSDAKPVGTVWFAWCVGGETHSEKCGTLRRPRRHPCGHTALCAAAAAGPPARLIPSPNHPCRCCFALPCYRTVCGFAPRHE